MPKRPTMRDVALKAGVGVATVDRVLNGRRKVRDESAHRVYEAAVELGYYAAPVIRYRLYEEAPEMTFGFLLPKENQPFYQQLSTTLLKEVERSQGVRGKAVFCYAKTQLAAEHADLLLTLKSQSDVVAASSIDHPRVTLAVQNLQEANIPTFALLNDFAVPIRRSYVGLDNIKVGRTAGWMLANTLRSAGSIAILVGGRLWSGHQLRELGFRSFFRENVPDITLRDSVLNLETSQFTYEMMLDIIASTPDLCGIYITGGGMEGAIRALRETKKPNEIPLIVHPYTEISQLALADRYVTMVIGTPIDSLCQTLINRMKEVFLDQSTAIPELHHLQPNFFLPESGRY